MATANTIKSSLESSLEENKLETEKTIKYQNVRGFNFYKGCY
jgi:hypothetical protein